MSNKIGLCKYCWEVLCSQCQENLIDDDNDHVSKSELRKWCEKMINDAHPDYDYDYVYGKGTSDICRKILEKFCAGEL